jgi:DUF1009 family protein
MTIPSSSIPSNAHITLPSPSSDDINDVLSAIDLASALCRAVGQGFVALPSVVAVFLAT